MRLESIEAWIPEDRIEVAKILDAAGAPPEAIRSFADLFGMHTVAAADTALGALGYLGLLLERLSPGPVVAGPRAFFHAHSLPMRPGQRLLTPADLHRRFPALADIGDVFDVDQFNCAGLFYALSAAKRLLDAGLIGEALIFGGDCLADWHLADRYVPGCTVLGDAYVLMRVTGRTGGLQIGNLATWDYRGFANGLEAGAAEMAAFNRRQMQIIADTLCRAAHDPRHDDIFPHNINGLCWRLYRRQSGGGAARIHDDLAGEIGHCCNADPFLTLAREAAAGPVCGTLLSIGMAGFTGAASVRGSCPGGTPPG